MTESPGPCFTKVLTQLNPHQAQMQHSRTALWLCFAGVWIELPGCCCQQLLSQGTAREVPCPGSALLWAALSCLDAAAAAAIEVVLKVRGGSGGAGAVAAAAGCGPCRFGLEPGGPRIRMQLRSKQAGRRAARAQRARRGRCQGACCEHIQGQSGSASEALVKHTMMG